MPKLRKFAPGQFQIINKRDGNTPYLNPNQTIRNLMLTSKKKNSRQEDRRSPSKSCDR